MSGELREDPDPQVRVFGSTERTGDMVNTFPLPIHSLLSQQHARQHGPRLFEITTDDPEGVVVKDKFDRVLTVLTKGCFVVSITWDFQQEWHLCFVEPNIKR